MYATQRQIDYLISLYNQVHGTQAAYLSQCTALKLTMRERQGQMAKTEASRMITALKRQANK